MVAAIQSELYDFYWALRDEQGDPKQLVTAFVSEHANLLEPVAALRGDDQSIPSADSDALWLFYALHRVADYLAVLSPALFARLLEGLGLERMTERIFHPAFHEVVEVRERGPWECLETHLPGFMWGSMIFARERVVATVPEHVDAECITGSTLFWAHRRPERPCYDLSIGWGSKSQWRTAFRRDYVVGKRVHYNVDAGSRTDELGLDVQQQNDILRFRHLLQPVEGFRADDVWPWDLGSTDATEEMP